MNGHVSQICISVLTATALLSGVHAGKNDKLKPEELIERHLDELGSPEDLALRTGFKADGMAQMEVVTGGSGQLQGPALLISEGRKLKVSMTFGINDYPGEVFGYDGKNVEVGWIQPGVRSVLGQFLYQFDELLSEGLIGGPLSTGWALLHVEELNPKLKYEGLKKVEGSEYHTLRYQPRKSSSVQTRLYFDPETYRHIHSIHKVRITSPILASADGASATQPETWYTLMETFSNFQPLQGISLPTRWVMEFTKEIGREGSVLRFTTQYSQITNNPELSDDDFKVHH